MISTDFESYDKFVVDIKTYFNLVEQPALAYDELKSVMYEQLKQRRPMPDMLDFKYRVSREAKEDVTVNYDSYVLLENEEEIDLHSSNSKSNKIWQSVNEKGKIINNVTQDIIDKYKLDEEKENEFGLNEAADRRKKLQSETVAEQVEISTSTGIDLSGLFTDGGVSTNQIDLSSMNFDDTEEENQDDTKLKEQEVFGSLTNLFDELDVGQEESVEELQDVVDFVEPEQKENVDESQEQEQVEEISNDCDEIDTENDENVSALETDEESVDNSEIRQQEQSVEKFEIENEKLVDLNENLVENREDDLINQQVETVENGEIERDEEIKESASVKDAEERIKRQVSKNTVVESLFSNIDDDFGFEESEKVVKTEKKQEVNKVEKPVEKSIQKENPTITDTARIRRQKTLVEETPPIKKQDEPTDLRQFLKKHPKSEISFVEQYFTKKQINDALKMGRIIKRGTVLRLP